MEIYALFDNCNYEKVSLDFLQPHSRANSVEITFLANVPDNIRESADRGIKEAYFWLSKHYKQVPNKLSVWCRGFEVNPQGNSTDLAYAVALICHMISEGYLKSSEVPSIVCATGVINKSGEVVRVNGIREKMVSAIKLCSNINNGIILIPEENLSEYDSLLEDDDFVSNADARVIAVKSIKDVLEAFGLKSVPKSKIRYWISGIAFGLAITGLCFSAFLNENKGNVIADNTKDSQVSVNVPSKHLKQTGNRTTENPKEARSLGSSLVNLTELTPSPIDVPEDNDSISKKDNLVYSNKPLEVAQIAPTTSMNSSIKKVENSDAPRLFACNAQVDSKTNAPRITIVFDEVDIKEGPEFKNIRITDDGCKLLKTEIDKGRQALNIDVMGRYGRPINITIPEGTVVSENGRKNSFYTYSITPLNDKKLLLDKVTNRNLEGWLTETKDERISTFTIGDNPAEVHSGDYSAKIISTEENTAKYKYLLRGIRRGANYRLSGFVKTKDTERENGAALCAQLENEVIMSKIISGTSDWQLVSFEFNSGDLERLEIECMLVGKGTAWFDDLTIEELL